MVKQSRKKSRRQKHKPYRRQSRKMVGGEFTNEEINELSHLGFNENDISVLSDANVKLNVVKLSLQQINPNTGNLFTPNELIDSINDTNEEINQMNVSGISNASDDEHNLNDSFMSNNDSLISNTDSMNTTRESNSSLNRNNSFGSYDSHGSLHISHLDNNDSVNTTKDNSFGGKKRKSTKKRKITRKRKGRKNTRKYRTQRGGICYGNGVGANNYDPNFSIYNTRELQLFPYKPE